MKNRLTSLILLVLFLMGVIQAFAQSPNWSYRVSASNRNVYLWLPPSVDGNGVRGLIIASLTVTEDAFVLNPLVRQVANEERLGIMYFANGSFSNPAVADTTAFNNLLESFITQSGYNELRYCPWLTFGMSTSGNFSRFLATWKPHRTIGHILYKSGFGNVRENGTVVDNTLRPAFAQNPEWQVPLFILNGQYEEYSGYQNMSGAEIDRFTERKWQLVRDSAVFNRQRVNPYLVSASCAAGEGHFDWSYRADTLVAAFIKKATQARVPANGYARDKEITLNIVNESSGWLGDTSVIADNPRVYPFSDSASVKGNKFWFFDQEMANIWLRYHQGQFGKSKDSIVVRANPSIAWNAGAAQYQINNQALTVRFTLFDTLSRLGQPVKYRKIAGGGILTRNAAGTADSLAPDIINIADANGTFGANRRVWISAYSDATATTSYRDVNIAVQFKSTSSKNAIIIGIPLSPTGWRSGDTAVINSNATRLSVISGPGMLINNGTQIVFTRSPNNNASTIPLRIRAQGSGAQINNFKDTVINVKMYPYGIGAETPAIAPDRANFCNGRAAFRVVNPASGVFYRWYSRNGVLLSTTDSLIITSATENDTISVRAFRNANDSSIAAIVYLSIPTSPNVPAPTDNPYRTRYNPAVNHWTDSLHWDRIYIVTNYGIDVCNSPEENSTALQALNVLVSNAGGGVIFFPPGIYPLKESFYLKTGVILRGVTPTTASAKDSSFRPQSKLLFPRYIPTFEGDGTPVTTAFKHIDADTNAFNLAIVNLDINRAAIDIHPKEYVVGSSNTAQPVDANRNVLVFGVRSNNVALPDPAVPNTTQSVPQYRWQRWSFRFAGNIDILGAGNMIVANCRVNDEVTDSFEQPDYQYNGIGGTDCGGAPPSATMFNYTDHYGIVINRNKFQIGGTPLPVGHSGGSNAITGVAYFSYAWVTGASPQQEPYLFMPGNEMLDNWVFKTMRIGLQAAGIGLVIKGNETYDRPNKSVWLVPTGVGCQTNNSATYENRGLDFSGWNVTIDSNIIGCHRHKLKNTPYFTVDGEGILLQECCGGTAVNDYKITRNRLVQEGYIGIYKMGDINNLLIKDNNLDGRQILVNANISAGEGSGLDNYKFLSNMILDGNIGVSGFNINGNRGGKNGIIRNNIMTPTGGATNVVIPCHVIIEPNNVNVRGIRYTPVITYDTIISGTDTILNTPAPKSTSLSTSGPCAEINVVQVSLVLPQNDTTLAASTSSFTLKAKVIGGNVEKTMVRFLVNNVFVSPDSVFTGADSTVSFTYNIPGSGFYNITAFARDTLAKINAYSSTYKITVNNPFSSAIVPDFSPASVCKSLVANFTNLTTIPNGDTLVSAEWDFTNDGIFDQTTTTLSGVSFTYPAFGNYDVRLRITIRNANRGSNPIVTETVTKTIRLLNPVASFNPSKTTLCVGETVNFTPTSVANATSYEWDFNNDGTVDAIRSSATMVSNTFNTAGISVVRLRVVTLGGCDSVITQSIIVNGIPTISFTISEDTICAGETITFAANASATMNFTFEPDTATGITSQMGSGTSFSRTFNYTAGTFFPKITASNNCITYEAKDTILVYNSPAQPTVSAMSMSLGSAVLTVNPNGTVAPFGIKWYKGSNLIPAETNSSITVTEFGTYFAEISKGNCATKSEGFVVGNILGVSENGLTYGLQAYPNPVEDLLTLSVVNPYYGSISCDVLTVDGKLVKSTTFNKTKESEAFSIDSSELKAGTYFVKVTLNGNTSVITILKK